MAGCSTRTWPDRSAETLEFLDGREALFDSRVSGGVVDGHGDLLADDIFCLPDGPRMLDCIEFDDRLRYLDGLDDVAFLAMDLEYLGAADLGARLLHWYAEFAGDPAPASLRHHFVAYRAFVRAKVACMRHAARRRGGRRGRRASGRYRPSATCGGAGCSLVLVGGSPATGKSSLAGAVADRLGCPCSCPADQCARNSPGFPWSAALPFPTPRASTPRRGRNAVMPSSCTAPGCCWPVASR